MSQRLHLELDLDPGEPIAGSLCGPDGGERSFVGWLDLLVALDAACKAASAQEAAGRSREHSDR